LLTSADAAHLALPPSVISPALRRYSNAHSTAGGSTPSVERLRMSRAELQRPNLREGELPMFSALFDPEMLTILLVAVISGGTFYFVMHRRLSL
jgi:hypothetical protein